MKDGGSAFPVRNRWDSSQESFDVLNEGMSLRDYFAGQALGGLLSTSQLYTKEDGVIYAYISSVAYSYADAMLAVREKQE